MAFLIDIEKNNPKIHMQPLITPNSQSNLEKNNKARGVMLPDFKLHYKDIVIKMI